MRKRIWARVLFTIVAAAVAVAGWLLLAPRSLGGPVSFAIPDGKSMQPHLHEGDLVVLRSQPYYRVGDVVAYRSRLLERVVLHRIVARRGNRYVFAGDNNAWQDPERPTHDDLVGKEWVVLPGGGRRLSLLQDPRIAAMLAGLVGFLAAGGLGLFSDEQSKAEVQVA